MRGPLFAANPPVKTERFGRLVCIAVSFLAVAPGLALAQRVVLHAGTVLVAPDEEPLTRVSVIVDGAHISAIEPGFVAGDRVIDLTDRFVMPGLFDLHVHLTSYADRHGATDPATISAADLALIGADNARRTVRAGFTTVLDLGTGRRSHEEAIYALRDAIAAQRLPGPRIFAAGSPISVTGQERAGRFRDEIEAVIGPEAVCNGPNDCRRAVREQVQRGADGISFYNTGSLLAPDSVAQAMTEAEMRAIVEAAHALGRKVIADGHHPAGVQAAIRAGVDAVDSVLLADGATLELARANGVFVLSQIYAVENAVGDSRDTMSQGLWGWLPQPLLERFFAIKSRPYPVAVAYRLNSDKLVLATDAGAHPHGTNARELIAYVEHGIDPVTVLKAATVNAAALLGLADEAGALRAGLRADIIAVDGNPLFDMTAMSEVTFVMSGGVIHAP